MKDLLGDLLAFEEYNIYLTYLSSLDDLNLLITEGIMTLFINHNMYGYLANFFDMYNDQLKVSKIDEQTLQSISQQEDEVIRLDRSEDGRSAAETGMSTS